MRHPDLFVEIDQAVDDIARTIRARSRYAPLAHLKYSNGLTRWRAEAPTRKMPDHLFDQVRGVLLSYKTATGERVVSPERLNRIDRAWDHYRATVHALPDKVPQSWLELVADEGMDRHQLADPHLFMGMLYRRLYEPMLRGDQALFDRNYDSIRPAVMLKDALLPYDRDRYTALREIFLVCAAFCFYRFDDPREDACLAQMRADFRATRSDLLRATLLGHAYFHNPWGLAASRAMNMAIEGRRIGWGGYFSPLTEYGRAASSAIFRGFALDDRPRCLHGHTVGDALNRCVDAHDERNHLSIASTFRIVGAQAHARRGQIDAVLDVTFPVRITARNRFGFRVPMIDQLAYLVEAEAYFYAAKGNNRRFLIEAGERTRCYFELQDGSGRRWSNVCEGAFISQLWRVSLDVLGTVEHLETTDAGRKFGEWWRASHDLSGRADNQGRRRLYTVPPHVVGIPGVQGAEPPAAQACLVVS